ncbi:MAG TPA: nuclear transport factor 2 family protein [Pyrinomonadaceae bacterium]|nr:nuclear transport factor 2 family protein [Pyrinomonadaceae bacterium]
MKSLTKSFAAARPDGVLSRAAALLVVSLLLTGWAGAQSKGDGAAQKELRERIAALDAALFAAYNACDIDKVGAFFTEDLEFYHEKGGVTLTRNASLDIMRKNLCGGDNRVRRELVAASLEVRPISNYGAVQTGEHRFYLTQKGQPEKLDGIGKFVMLWQQKDGEWRISRVVSYGFRPPE